MDVLVRETKAKQVNPQAGAVMPAPGHFWIFKAFFLLLHEKEGM